MKADVWWVVGGALAVLAVVLGVLADRYLCAVYWWPLVGTEWRAERRGSYDDAYDYRGTDRPGDGETGPDAYVTGSVRGPVLGAVDDEDEDWADQLHVINAELHDEQQEQAPPGGHPIYAELSDDPDLIVWDAAQQAKRCWEIVHIEFPRLHTALLAEYAVAA